MAVAVFCQITKLQKNMDFRPFYGHFHLWLLSAEEF